MKAKSESFVKTETSQNVGPTKRPPYPQPNSQGIKERKRAAKPKNYSDLNLTGMPLTLWVTPGNPSPTETKALF